MSKTDPLPEHVRGLPVEIQVAVLYERVANLEGKVTSLSRSIVAGIGTLVTGMILYLFSVSSGWIGPDKSTSSTLGEVASWAIAGLGSAFSWLLW